MAHRIIETDADLEALWHPAPGYYGRYEITRDGRVRSLPRFVNSPAAGGQRKISGKAIAIQLVKGYPAFLARGEDGKKTTAYLHRLIAMAFVPNPDGKPHVNHIDGDKANFDPANLEWVTRAENMQHAHDTGLMPPSTIGPGEDSPAAKLDWDEVNEIRSLLRDGLSHRAIAARFGVKKGAIGCIARNETWKVEA